VSLAMSMEEASPLCLKRSLHICGARCHARLQRSSDLILHGLEWPSQGAASDVQPLDAYDVAIMQLGHKNAKFSLSSRICCHNLMHSF